MIVGGVTAMNIRREEIGAATLYQGESYEVMQELIERGELFDGLITDPPYSSGGQFRGDRMQKTSAKYQNTEQAGRYEEFTGDNRDQRSQLIWCMLWLSQCFKLLRDGAPVGLFTDWRQLPITTDALQCAGFVWRGVAVWDKGNSRPVKGRYRSQCEYLVWGSKGGMVNEGECLPGCWRVNVVGANKEHIAAKPVQLMGHINKIIPPGGVIFDPFMGSGSTGVAAVQDQRRFVGVEMLETHFETARRRLVEAQAQGDLFAEVVR